MKPLYGIITPVLMAGIFYVLPDRPEQADNSLLERDQNFFVVEDSNKKDTTKLRYPIDANQNSGEKSKNNLDLEDPEVIKKEVYYDPEDGTYKTRQTIGGEEYRPTETKSFNEYFKESQDDEINDYFRKRSQAQTFVRGGGLIPPLPVGPKIFDKIFGGGTIDIRPQGSAELIFGWNYNVVRNPALTTRQQKNGQFDFDQKIQLNLTGSIGDRMKIATNYDTEATFDFENQMKLNWEGKEDDIVKKVELGNVSLPLNSSLINGGQSLFGIKTQLQFGKLTVSSILTQQRGQTSETQVTGGAQITKFDIQVDNYDVNRHYFLGQYFANNYDRWLANIPVISSPVIINRVEVWVTNRTQDYTTARDIIGFMDLGEPQPYNSLKWQGSNLQVTTNEANTLYNQVSTAQGTRSSLSAVTTLESGSFSLDKIKDFQFLSSARQLSPNEYTFHPQLGYVSLNTALNNDEILAVAYEYTVNGIPYKVGEFANDVPDQQANPQALFLKMLKGTTITTELPIWDLMMKNIYSLSAFNIQPDKFMLDVVYADDFSGADYTYLPAQGEPQLMNEVLISTMNLDKINVQGEPQPDGMFDFLPGVTINPHNGRIIFPVREPFGSHLRSRLNSPANVEKYVFQELYDSTKWLAQQVVLKNKFFLRGSFQSVANNEISLNAFNVPQGSVKVTANGTLLQENIDYVVDYNLGKVTIINAALLESGAVINVTSENNSLFNIQQKSLVGTRLDYKVNKDLILGGTVMHLWEKPITPKVNIGDEPLMNTIYGLDGAYNTESRWLTKMVDKLPFLETKEISTITLTGEFAQLIPHQPKTIGERGTSFIDDFEASETPFDLREPTNWFLASTPEGQADQFPYGNSTGLPYNFRRAKLAWYKIDPFFQTGRGTGQPTAPDYIKNDVDAVSDHYVRGVTIREVFPNRELQNIQPPQLVTLDLAYYPSMRGAYNYNVGIINPDGTLKDPEENWGGIQRKIETNDFEAANIDYIEIWMMSPFLKDQSINGTMYINLGQISEDVLKDRQKSYENGLPTTSTPSRVDSNGVARVPIGRALNNAFANEDQNIRNMQDVGLDGYNDQGERDVYKNFIDSLAQLIGTGSAGYQQFVADPSADNYSFHSSSQFDQQLKTIQDRYMDYNGMEGNSPLATFAPDGYPIARTNKPDDEDINGDFSLNTIEQYYQYKININQADLSTPGENFVAGVQVSNVPLDNGKREDVPWYLLRIPISAFEKKVGDINDFKSIRFMRVVLTDFDKPVVLRFGQFQLVRADWRRHLKSLAEPVDSPPTNPADNTVFSTGTVNIEENGAGTPVRYVLPPGFFREVDVTTPGNIQQNEQSLLVNVCKLKDGDGRGVFKTTQFDIRNYKNLQMFVHAESPEPNTLKDGDLHAFIRLGTDLESNYYEYSVPLKITPHGATEPEIIWPDENQLNIALEELYLTKQLRSNASYPLTEEYTRTLNAGKQIRVKGLPDLSNVRVIMLGVKNPLKLDNPADDGLEKCGTVWFNELRVSEFINQGGWASNGRLVAKLADFGTFTASVNYQSIGFGGLDKKLNDRNLDETFMYDLSGNFELGKFLPAKTGISVPFFIGHSEQIVRPKYNPLNPDILLETAIRAAQTEQEADEIKNNAEHLTVRKSYNFTNVRKNRTGDKKPRLYNIENFNASYSYVEVFQRSQYVRENLQKTYRGSLGYNFAPKSKKIEPFKGIGRSPWLALIREFNLTLFPQSLSARVDLDRYYSRLINRNNDAPNTIVPVLYNKNFTMTRFYDFRWDLTSNLKLDYQANALARIDEPHGKISREETPDSVQVILDNLKNLGRLTNFNQSATVNYTVPLNKIPILNWITLSTSYKANYQWITAPPVALSLGNTIQNSQTLAGTGNFNLINFYNKVPYLKAVNQGQRKKPKKKPADGEKKEEEEKEKKKEAKSGNTLVRMLMMVRNVNIDYSQTRGIFLPGFNQTPQYFGNNFDANPNAPGLPFIFGSQDENIRYDLARNGFLTSDTNARTPYTQTLSTSIRPRATLEPIRDLRIDVNWLKTETRNTQSNFRYNPETDQFEDFGYQESGTFNMTINTWRTAFGKIDDLGRSEAYIQFENDRYTMSERLATEDERWQGRTQKIDSNGYYKGYGRTSQDVLIASFLSAYTGKDANSIATSPFPNMPLPNWNLTYNGLSKIKAVSNFANNITLRHAYNSTYSVGSFVSNLTNNIDTSQGGDYTPKYNIRTVTIAEQFSPFLSLEIGWKNNLTTRFEYKRARIINLEVTNSSVTENRTNEFIIGLGYKVKGFRLPFKINRKKPYLPNDLDIRFDFSIRDNKTAVMRIDDVSSITAQGNKIISIKPTIDYKINDKLNLRLFYDRRSTTPAVSTQFPTAITRGGLSLRYTIQ